MSGEPLPLDSPEWARLSHAYGHASDIPEILRQLERHPTNPGREAAWDSLWSALAHQGDVYSASFAAVPHVIRILAAAPEAAEETFFRFPAWVEICRGRTGVAVPGFLLRPYRDALDKLPACADAAAAVHDWSYDFSRAALAAIAAAKGQLELAAILLDLDEPLKTHVLKRMKEQDY